MIQTLLTSRLLTFHIIFWAVALMFVFQLKSLCFCLPLVSTTLFCWHFFVVRDSVLCICVCSALLKKL